MLFTIRLSRETFPPLFLFSPQFLFLREFFSCAPLSERLQQARTRLIFVTCPTSSILMAVDNFSGYALHRTKNQVSVKLNMVETRDSVAETQRQTRVSVSGYITVSHVSVAAFSTEPEHFFTCFRQISVSGIMYFCNC